MKAAVPEGMNTEGKCPRPPVCSCSHPEDNLPAGGVFSTITDDMGASRDFKIRGYTIGQAPNLPLIVVIVAAVVGRMTEQGSVTNRTADSVFFVGLSIWSYLETFDGANTFRRALGIAGFVVVLTRLVGQLQ